MSSPRGAFGPLWGTQIRFRAGGRLRDRVRLGSSSVTNPREPPLLISFLYLSLRKLIELVALRLRSADYKELEIVVPRHEVTILRRQVRRPDLRPADRFLLAAAAQLLPRWRWSAFFVTPLMPRFGTGRHRGHGRARSKEHGTSSASSTGGCLADAKTKFASKPRRTMPETI